MKTINPEWKKPVCSVRSAHKNIETVVVPKEEQKRFDTLMGDLHYLGSAKPAGDFLRQAVICDGQWVAILAWRPACYALRDRDEWIGWHAALRAERQKLLVQNRRYLLLHERGYRPLLAETFTDIEKFRGTCYKV